MPTIEKSIGHILDAHQAFGKMVKSSHFFVCFAFLSLHCWEDDFVGKHCGAWPTLCARKLRPWYQKCMFRAVSSECDSLLWRPWTASQPVPISVCIFPVVYSFWVNIVVWKGFENVIVMVYSFFPAIHIQKWNISLAQISERNRIFLLTQKYVYYPHPLVLF